MSVITFAELMYGALKSQTSVTNLEKLQRLRQLIPVLDFDSNAAEAYGKIRTDLEKQGQLIGSNDLLIAAHLHKLSGDKAGLYSVSVSGNWRVFFEFIEGDVYIVDYDDYH
jgi:hypothetical protein